jgi:hypothetical protein
MAIRIRLYEGSSVKGSTSNTAFYQENTSSSLEIVVMWADKTTLHTIPHPRNQGLVTQYEFDDYAADTSGGHHHGKTLRGEVTFGGRRRHRFMMSATC